MGAFALSRRVPYDVRCNCFGRLGGSEFSGYTMAVSAILLATAFGWAESNGDLATFAAYPLRLLALVPPGVIIFAHRKSVANSMTRQDSLRSHRDSHGGGH
jgi:hypothetical protein